MRATDAAGNTGTSATDSFTLDTLPPVTEAPVPSETSVPSDVPPTDELSPVDDAAATITPTEFVPEIEAAEEIAGGGDSSAVLSSEQLQINLPTALTEEMA